MDLEKIKKSKTKVIGKKIQYYKQIDSTHLQAKRIVESSENGEILIAEIQNKGIGTKGRNWYTGSEKNIAMTIILKPKCKINQLQGITIHIAKIIQKTINQRYNCNLTIKEPNDLMLNGKKISGILTEINSIGEKINYLLISIGFNVNEDKFSKETIEIATSLKKEYKKDFEREEIIKAIIENLEEGIEI